MRKTIFISVLVLSSIFLAAACGSGATATDTTLANQVNIKVESNPNPAMTLAPGASAGVGNAELVFIITDANGNPIEGASVDVSADHTDMSGMGMSGPATDQGGGQYAINANFQHSGNWKLTVYVRKDRLDYKEDIEFKVQ